MLEDGWHTLHVIPLGPSTVLVALHRILLDVWTYFCARFELKRQEGWASMWGKICVEEAEKDIILILCNQQHTG